MLLNILKYNDILHHLMISSNGLYLKMSHAGKYEELNKTIDSYIRLINAAKNSIKDLDEKIGKYLNEIRTLKEDQKNLEEELSNVQEYIKNLPKSQNPEVIELENKLPEILYSINTSNDRLASLNHESNETHETLKFLQDC